MTEEIIQGITGNCTNLADKFSPIFMFEDYSLIYNREVVKWLEKNMFMFQAIGFVVPRFKKNIYQRNFKKMIFSNLPILSYYSLASLNGGNFKTGKYKVLFDADFTMQHERSSLEVGEFVFTQLTDPKINCEPNFWNQKSLVSRNKIDGTKKSGDNTETIIFNLDTAVQLKKFLKFLDSSSSSIKNSVTLKGIPAKFDCAFLDECRWINKECPAIQFRRIIINKNGAIFPCFNGRKIGEVGEPREKIIKKMKKLQDNIKKERGCNSCPVKENCSKCPFPHSFTSVEYCKIKKCYAHMENIFKLFKIMRKINLFSSQEDRGDLVSGKFTPDLVQVITKNKKYLYHSIGRLYENYQEAKT